MQDHDFQLIYCKFHASDVFVKQHNVKIMQSINMLTVNCYNLLQLNRIAL